MGPFSLSGLLPIQHVQLEWKQKFKNNAPHKKKEFTRDCIIFTQAARHFFFLISKEILCHCIPGNFSFWPLCKNTFIWCFSGFAFLFVIFSHTQRESAESYPGFEEWEHLHQILGKGCWREREHQLWDDRNLFGHQTDKWFRGIWWWWWLIPVFLIFPWHLLNVVCTLLINLSVCD